MKYEYIPTPFVMTADVLMEIEPGLRSQDPAMVQLLVDKVNASIEAVKESPAYRATIDEIMNEGSSRITSGLAALVRRK